MPPGLSFLQFLKRIAGGRFTYLLAFMFFSILAFPVLEQAAYGPVIIQVSYSIMLVSALYAVWHVRWIFRTGVVLFLAAILSHWWIVLTLDPIAVFVGVFLEILFFCFVAGSVLLHVFGHEQVTGDTIAGSICVFFLMGIIWMLAYQGIYFFDHEAFHNVSARSFTPAATADLIYYSFATLTTLGYGDIVPLSKAARMVAVTEAILGQIFLTVLVARLVGLYGLKRVQRAQ